MKHILLFCSALAFSNAVFALVCPTCIGTECRQPVVPTKVCTYQRPFPLVKNGQAEAEFACLHAEYYSEGVLKEVSQCVVTTGNDLCETLKDIYTVKTCTLKQPASLVKNINDHEGNSGFIEFGDSAGNGDGTESAESTGNRIDEIEFFEFKENSDYTELYESSGDSDESNSSKSPGSTESTASSGSTGSSESPGSSDSIGSTNDDNPTTPHHNGTVEMGQMSIVFILLTSLYLWRF